ncbi:hypothetical protein BD626DRAFT_99120 [Schizophyllum amplum]|uniref:Fungal-type protein kinase domain-containing protein n=1 Tax=Schizophyllum amplum TaxID=97359 RepID=A0A550CR89_9AGAR|nr:hypothetical protein BD626DRAFT_99120 [Auriculariopsis ampla]
MERMRDSALSIAPRERLVQETSVGKEGLGGDCPKELCTVSSEHPKPLARLWRKESISAWFRCKDVHDPIDIYRKGPACTQSTNLMYPCQPGTRVFAVLNDWDLDTDATHRRFGTGTIPFMAIDLLSPEAMRGEVRHLYRHDLEAMIWVFVWIMCCYNAGRSRPVPEEVAEWTVQDPDAADGGKRKFSSRFNRSVAAPSWVAECPLAILLVNRVQGDLHEREKAVTLASVFGGIQPEETDEPEKVWKEHWALVKDTCKNKALPQLAYIVELSPKDDD